MEKRLFESLEVFSYPVKMSTLGFCRLLKDRSLKNWDKHRAHTLSTRLEVIFNNYSSSPNLLLPKTKWAIDSEAMRARGIIVLVKSNQLVKKYRDKQLQLVKARLEAFFCRQKASALRYQWAIRCSLVVTQPTERSIDNRPLVGFY